MTIRGRQAEGTLGIPGPLPRNYRLDLAEPTAERAVSELLLIAAGDTTIANDATEESLLAGTLLGETRLRAAMFAGAALIEFAFWGLYGTQNAPGQTLQLRAYMGATVVLDTGAVAITQNMTDKVWRCEGIICSREPGSVAQLAAQGLAWFTNSGGGGVVGMPNSGLISADLSDEKSFDFTAQWGAAHASNSLKLTNGFVRIGV